MQNLGKKKEKKLRKNTKKKKKLPHVTYFIIKNFCHVISFF